MLHFYLLIMLVKKFVFKNERYLKGILKRLSAYNLLEWYTKLQTILFANVNVLLEYYSNTGKATSLYKL